MPEYTFADIITGKDILTDLVKDKDIVGARGYFTDNLQTIVDSLDDETFPDPLLEGTVETVSYAGRFKRKADGEYYSYFIRKKEPKYVPFDLSDAAVREGLWGKRIIINEPYSIGEKPCKREVHSMITGFTYCMDGEPKDDWTINAGECSLNAEEALEYAHFYDSTPCGRLVEG